MRMRLLFVVLTASLMAADRAPGQQAQTKRGLTGAWTIVTFERGGQKNDGASGEVTFSHDKVVVKGMNGEHEGTYQLHADKSPMQIDFTPSNGDNAGKVHKGIYQLKGNRLKILLAPPNEERPKDFKGKEGEGRLYVELKRKKD